MVATAVDRVHVPEGELGDLERFVRAEYPTLVTALAVMCGSRTAAEDVAQEALARAVLAQGRGKQIQTVGAWVRTVSMNVLRNRWRSLLRERAALHRVAGLPEGTADGPSSEARLDLERAVAGLPRRQREAVALFYLLDLTVADTAEAMRVSEGTVKTLLSRAREGLEVALVESEGGVV